MQRNEPTEIQFNLLLQNPGKQKNIAKDLSQFLFSGGGKQWGSGEARKKTPSHVSPVTSCSSCLHVGGVV